MNAVGWTGGALAPVAVGWVLQRGGAGSEAAVLSRVVAMGAAVYLVAAALLAVGVRFLVARDVARLRARELR